MDPSMQYQNQSQPYDPSSSSLAAAPSAAAYYPYPQYGNYPYYPQDYSNYQPHPQSTEASSLHPPGVPIDSQPQQYPGHHDQYYAAYHHHHHHQQQQQQQQYDASTWQGGSEGSHVAARPSSQYESAMWHNGGAVSEAGNFGPRPPVGPSYPAGGRRGGRGAGSSLRGRGRGRGRGGPIPGAQPQQSAPPPQKAWCELCRVDCNTAEILQNHLEGKKHKKNIKVKEELERLKKIIVERENVKVEHQVTETGARGRGSKRKMRGGRGGNKMMRTSEGSKREVAPNPKQQGVPFFCELCRVTCESQVVFDSHLRGRKHMSNLHEQQTLLGHAALEALYPALQAILPTLQGNYPPNPDAPLFQQDGQDTQAILTQLLTTLLTTGQVGVTPGSASTSAPVPPLITENLNPENVPAQPEEGSRGAADVAAESETQLESVNTVAVVGVTIEKEAETIEPENEKVVDAEPAVNP